MVCSLPLEQRYQQEAKSHRWMREHAHGGGVTSANRDWHYWSLEDPAE